MPGPVVCVRARPCGGASSPLVVAKPTGSAVRTRRVSRTLRRTVSGCAPGGASTCQSTATAGSRARSSGSRGRGSVPRTRAGPRRRRCRPRSTASRAGRRRDQPAQPGHAVMPAPLGRAGRRASLPPLGRGARRRPGRGWRRRARRRCSAASSSTATTRRRCRRSSWPVGSSARISCGRAGQHAGDRDALRLPTGQLVGQLRGERGEVRAARAPPARRVARRCPGRRRAAAAARRSRRRRARAAGSAPGTRPAGPGAVRPGPGHAPAVGVSSPATGAAGSTCPIPDGPTSATRAPARPRSRSAGAPTVAAAPLP